VNFADGLAQRPSRADLFKNYDQWREALQTDEPTEPGKLTAPAGFQVELVRAATEGEGSWINVAFDPQGRAVIAREDQGLLRLPIVQGKPGAIETIESTLKECRGLLFAYDSLYVNANHSKALYRLRDTNGDDALDEVTLLRATPGGVGHGRNNLALGPDGDIYLIHGNDVRLPADFEPADSQYRNYAADRLTPCRWDSTLFNAGATLPAGHVIRTDRDGRRWRLFAGGFRNPYGVAFNRDGELFTFDADMEWDLGAPWYRPTRINHVVSGGDFGWRQGTGKLPAWYPDSPPTTLDIGLGSPTGVKFGYSSNYPPHWRDALFVLDWSYGRIIAVHMKPSGASYRATPELFVRGRPLNVTGLDFGPDGAMYFVTGGRKTQSGLYRVRYVGPQVSAQAPTDADRAHEESCRKLRTLRRRLEALHGRQDAQAIVEAWPHLDHADPWVRYAARTAVEHQPADQWRERALSESRPVGALTALFALARVGDASVQPKLLGRLSKANLERQPADNQLLAARIYAVCIARMGRPEADVAAALQTQLEGIYPSADARVNQVVGELLVYLDSPHAVARTMPLLASAKTKDELIAYLFYLRNAKAGWTDALQRDYFAWLRKADALSGGRYIPQFVAAIRAEAVDALSIEQRAALHDLIKPPSTPKVDLPDMFKRPVVKKWTVADLEGSLDEVGQGRDFEQGKAMFQAALCMRCHRISGASPLGPDLLAMVRRSSRRDLLEAMIDPSKAIGDKYRNAILQKQDGTVVTGMVVGGDAMKIVLSTNPLNPQEQATVLKSEIDSAKASPVSPMPAGLLDTLKKEEILDLLAYLEALGNPNARNFRP
jgi:hypothetical protein